MTIIVNLYVILDIEVLVEDPKYILNCTNTTDNCFPFINCFQTDPNVQVGVCLWGAR